MTKTIFRNTFLVGLSVLLLCTALFFGLQYTQTNEETYAALRQEAVYAARGSSLGGQAYLEGLDNGNRITWIAADGTVLYDNELAPPVADQRDYPEVRSALETGEGQGVRKSESSGVSTMYYARLCEDGTVLRLSRPLSSVLYALITVSPVLWVFVLALIISGVLSFRAARQIVRPINELDLDHPDEGTYPELSPLVGRIREQSLTIQGQLAELHRRQKEFSALTDSMSEGFLLLDRQGTVLSANQSALALLPACKPGDDLLPHLSDAGKNAVSLALEGKRADTLVEREGKSWDLIANPVTAHHQVSGAVILMMDVTEREQRERLRQEFSANVSHELKTPLTSISGFAELMAQGGVPEERVKEFSGDIYRESQRLIALVEDIIKLSKLDEEGIEPEWESVNLYDLAQDTLDSLKEVADRQQVTLDLMGDDGVEVNGVWQLLSEMVYNLCDNGIKYNRPGGSVTVEISATGTEARLTVSDTGIGIPYAHQDRVFERFYRVDKSHSKEIGGTGLGLSIVKHGAQFHGARVELESEPGAGTRIALIFPRG